MALARAVLVTLVLAMFTLGTARPQEKEEVTAAENMDEALKARDEGWNHRGRMNYMGEKQKKAAELEKRDREIDSDKIKAAMEWILAYARRQKRRKQLRFRVAGHFLGAELEKREEGKDIEHTRYSKERFHQRRKKTIASGWRTRWQATGGRYLGELDRVALNAREVKAAENMDEVLKARDEGFFNIWSGAQEKAAELEKRE